MTEDGSSHQKNETKLNKTHLRLIITAGMGFFTDAYDLFIIGVVTALLTPIWNLSSAQVAILNGSALASAALGAVAFGYLSDKFGRKKLYGFEILILFLGAILAATSVSFVDLLLARLVVGFGIGGDYPSSAAIVSESSNSKNRGFLVLLVFAIQALGLIVGPLLASLLIMTGIPKVYLWRILCAIGMIPAASVFFMRRNLKNQNQLDPNKKYPILDVSRKLKNILKNQDKRRNKPKGKFSKKYIKYLLGTAGAWFLLDVAFYGNGISSMLIIDKIEPHASLVAHTLISMFIFLLFAVPGYLLAAGTIDKIGRRKLQNLGFFMMALMFGLIAVFHAIQAHVIIFLIVFGTSFFFTNFGPNPTTFLIPSEIYPADIRARAHGISAAIGKVGAFAGAFCMPIVLAHFGLQKTLGLMAFVAILGIFATMLVPDMTNKHID